MLYSWRCWSDSGLASRLQCCAWPSVPIEAVVPMQRRVSGRLAFECAWVGAVIVLVAWLLLVLAGAL